MLTKPSLPRTLVTATLGATLTAAAFTASTATAAPAPAVPRPVVVPCGAVLTTSVRLAADVVCPDGRGLTLAADGIELNLNGHSLTGPAEEPGEDFSAAVVAGARGVVVRNGRIDGWGVGISAGRDVDDPAGEDDPAGGAAVDVTARGLRLTGNGSGVLAAAGGAVTVRDSWLSRNGFAGAAQFGGRLLVEGSTADRNDSGFFSFDVPAGGLVLRDATVRRSRSYGLGCGQDGHVDAERVTLQRNGTGLDVFQCDARVVDSAFVWNDRHVRTFLAEQDTVVIACTSFTRDGGPAGVPVVPCPGPGSAPAVP